MKDIELSDADIVSHSLILIGNQKTNKLWTKLGRSIALRVEDDKIGFGHHEWLGKYAFHAVLENPMNPLLHVLFVGATDMDMLSHCSMDTLFDGAYDFALWYVVGVSAAGGHG